MTPAPAATVVLLDDRRPARVFLVKRHGRAAFMANAYVFPGGRVDPADAAATPLIRGVDAAALAGRMRELAAPADALTHLVGAARETFEEAGALLASPRAGAWPEGLDAAALEVARRRVHSGEIGFLELLTRWDLVIDGASLVYFDHWITPPLESRRFDTRFFVTRAPAGQRYRHDDEETTASCWLTAAEALARHARGELGLAPPTFWILRQLRELGSADAALAWAAAREVPPIRPAVQADGSRLIISLDARGRVLWRGDHWVVEPAGEGR